MDIERLIARDERDELDRLRGDCDFLRKRLERYRWIKCSEKMPPRNGNYLVVTEGLGFYRGCTVIKLLYFYNGCFKLDDKDVYSVKVTHWMALPEMPEEDK